MDSKLFLKVSQREERVDRIKAFLVFLMAVLDLAIMLGRVRTNELVLDAKIMGSFLKKGLDIPADIPLHQPFQKVSRGAGGLLWIGGQEAELGELINGGVLEQTQLRVSDAAAGDDLHIHLDSFSRMGHLLVRFWCISLFLLLWEHPQFAHDAEQVLRAAGVAALFRAVPQLHQAELWIAAAHIPDQLQFRSGMLVRIVVRPLGLAGQGLYTSTPAGSPEVDIGRLLLYFRLARLIPYFSAYFIRDRLYAMSCVILLLMKDVASSR